MSQAVELRRPLVSCIRDFPKGCGPGAVVLDRKPKETPPHPLPSLPPSPPPATESKEYAACNGVAEPRVGDAAEVPSAEVEGNPSSAAGLISAPEAEPVGRTAPVECVEPHAVDSAMVFPGNVAAAKGKQDEVQDQGLQGSSDQDDKLEPPQLLEDGLEQSKALDVLRTEASHADGNLEKQCSPKIYPRPPPPRRTVSAVRDYPIGCGVNAPRMSREEALKIAAAASSKGKSPIEEMKPSVDQQPAFLKDFANSIVHNKVVEGVEQMTENGKIDKEASHEVRLEAKVSKYPLPSPKKIDKEAIQEVRVEARVSKSSLCSPKKIDKEDIQEVRVEGRVSKSPLPSPKSKSWEAEKQPIVVKESNSAKNEEKKIIARAAPDKKFDGQAIKPLSRNLQTIEAQKRKPLSPGKLVDKEGKLSLDNSIGRSLVKNQNVSKVIKRKFLDAIVDEGRAGIDKRLDDENVEAYGERLIIQALMAAPNCPWRQGRRSGASGSRSFATPKSKVKRERTTLDMQLALPKVKRERTTSDMQLALKEVEDEDFASHYEENETALVVHQESDELSVAIPPLAMCEGSGEFCVNFPPIAPAKDYSGSGMQDIAARHKVRRALRLFQVVCRKLLQGEEAKSNGSGNAKRVDLSAAQILKKHGEWVNTGKQIIGIVPGVEVGDTFQYRVELSIVGLHRPFQGGIDAAKKNGMSVAASIVASGCYNDDMEDLDVLIYSGSGGNPAGPDKPPEDQKLERGNLALKNSIDAKTPVRVIHGTKEMKEGSSHDTNTRQKLVSTFTYAGLYLVEKYWNEKGPHGFYVFKFQLRRIVGQPELKLQEAKRSRKSKVRKGLCLKDISDGKEKIPICVINEINDDHPPPFKYITKIKYPSWYAKTPPKGCDCTNGCSDSEKCACAVKNGGEIPFNFNGAIVQAKPLVYECGPSCKCPRSCHNRVSQRGIQIPLEIFRTQTRGWGVRSLYSIPSGSFICEYLGELLQDKEAEKRSNDEYLFDIGNYDDHSLWEGLPSLIPGLKTSSHCETVDDIHFTIDAAEYGNVGRFINHSCSPNLYAQNVLYDHDDKRMPHIMLFAAENIPPLQELTYHYNYSIDQVHDAEGNIKRKDCYCGSPECTGRLY